MPSAQEIFINKINYLRLSFSNSTLNDLPPPNPDHNNVAKILRNGMAVIGFVTLEDFIKRRTGEILNTISGTGLNFSQLPTGIQYSTTVDLLKSLSRLVKLKETTSDKILFIQDEAKNIASTILPPLSLSGFTFGYSKSNISKDDVPAILKAFRINDGWNQMSIISSRIGLTGLDLGNSFKNAANRRHAAAHDVNANTPINDLNQFIKEAIAIAVSFDIIISESVRLINSRNVDYLTRNRIINNTDVKINYVKKDSNFWKYIKESNTRATRRNRTKSVLIPFAEADTIANQENLIIYNDVGQIERWHVI